MFSKDGTPIHQTSFAIHGSGVDDILAYHTHFINVLGNPEKAYHNCLAVRGASIYVLGPTYLVVSRLLLWKERIQVLRRAGDWIGALNMAITLYDGQAHGVIDLPRSLEAIQNAIMPYMVELLLSYVDEVFSYISVASHNQYEKVQQLDDAETINSSVNSEIKEQFSRVGGVTVEFCIHIKRTDILFDEIFTRFVAVKHRGNVKSHHDHIVVEFSELFRKFDFVMSIAVYCQNLSGPFFSKNDMRTFHAYMFLNRN